LRAHPSAFAAYRYPNRSYPASSWEKVLAKSYGGVASDLGYALQSSGRKADLPLAERMLRTGIRLAPDLPANYKDLGVLLADNGGDPREVVSLFTRFLQLRPNDPQAGAIRAEIAKYGGTP
jgi:regulator of sirC expression with transglutaminase-like and TPR domain